MISITTVSLSNPRDIATLEQVIRETEISEVIKEAEDK